MAPTKRPPPNWQRLLADTAHVVQVQERQLARLWAGYGSVKELTVKQQHQHEAGGASGAPSVRRLVAKAVDPPRGKAGDVGHQRKLDSYAVEASFYRSCVPRMAGLAASLGYDPAGPRPAASPQPPETAPAAGSWCWCPQPVVVDAEPPEHFLFVLTDLRSSFPQQPHAYDLEEAKVALEWLASFHAAWWEEERPEGLWEDGCYWHLATRQEELAQTGGAWSELRRVAATVDEALRGGEARGAGAGAPPRRHTTLCHGDPKSANFMFSKDGRSAAAYDFQYVGSGYGTKDLVYLLVSSVDESVLQEDEQTLLNHYHACLTSRLKSLGKRDAAEAYTSDGVMAAHYDLAMVDYCRFMSGWGWWGATRYAERRCREALARLPAALEAAAAAVAR